MPLLTRARRVLTRALDRIEERLDSAPVEREDTGSIVANMLTGTGLAGADKGASGTINLSRSIIPEQSLTSLYRYGGLARRIVDIVPDHATRVQPVVQARDGEVVLARELEDLHLQDAVKQAWTWGRLYGGGYILLITDDVKTPLDQPLKRPARIKSLAVLDGTEVDPLEFQTDISQPRFREPTLYSVSPQGPGGSAVGIAVHWSRIVYIPGVLVPPSRRYQDRRHDDSMIDAIWTAIAGHEEFSSARRALMQEVSIATLTTDVPVFQSGTQSEAWQLRMRALTWGRSYASTILLNPNERYELAERNFAGWEHIGQAARTELCAVTGYPSVILWGTAPAGMSSDDASARRQWGALVAAESERRMVPAIRQVAEALLPDGETVTVEVPSVDQPSIAEQATIEKTRAETDALYMAHGVLSEEEVRKGRFGDGNGVIVIESDATLPDDINDPLTEL